MEEIFGDQKKIIIMKYPFVLFAISSVLLWWSSCNLQKDIDVDLPAYDSELVVECYLEPGKPYRLLLSESQAYFDNVNENPFIENAEVIITHRGVSETLPYGNFLDTEFNKFYNYQSTILVPAHYNEDFTLSITDDRGRTVSGTTQILNIIDIDSLVLQFNATDTAALILSYFNEPQDQKNWYRRQLHKGETVATAQVDQDFITDDILETDNGQYVFGSAFDYTFGDTIFSTLYHLDESYYDFLLSAFDAISANGNPFATPSQIRSNVDGGLGVFTGLSYDRDTLIVQ